MKGAQGPRCARCGGSLARGAVVVEVIRERHAVVLRWPAEPKRFIEALRVLYHAECEPSDP